MKHCNLDISTIEAALKMNGTHIPTSDFDLNPDQDFPNDMRLKGAAVLVPLVPRATGLHVLFTKRSAKMRNHPGQISFPGGRRDADDQDFWHTAHREATEEIGLTAQDVTCIGILPQHKTVTSFLVHPYVGVTRTNFMPKILTDEVDEVFEVPLDHLVKPENYKIKGRVWQGYKRQYYTVPYGPYYIWGATARILRMFTDILEQAHAH